MTTDKPIRAPQNINARRAPTAPPGIVEDAQMPSPPTPEKALPTDEIAAPEEGPLTLTAVHPKLVKPFAQSLIELKPQSVTKDRKRALAAPFVDARAYQTRLDRVVGPEGWSVSYRRLSDRAVVCRLTILGVTREDVGEADLEEFDRQSGEMKPNPNQATAAAMQAFKRACAAFGLGRYLYSLQTTWADYDAEKRQIVNPAGVVAQMYAAAGFTNGS